MYTLNSMTDEDLGLVLNGTDWLTTPLDNAGLLDNYNLEDVLNLPLDPFLFDPPITTPVEDSTALDLACLSWLDDLQASTHPPLPVAEPSPSTDPPPLSPPSAPSLPSPPAPISPRSDPEPEPFSTFESRWQAVLNRTPTNSFVYGVISTKIYCRPTCPSRRPHRSNAIFFSTPAEGNQLGYRPCKRCRPEDEAGEAAEQRQAAAVERAKAFIEAKAKKGERVGLEKLASEAGLSTFYFHRVFKRRVGVTPEEWGKMCRQRWAG